MAAFTLGKLLTKEVLGLGFEISGAATRGKIDGGWRNRRKDGVRDMRESMPESLCCDTSECLVQEGPAHMKPEQSVEAVVTARPGGCWRLGV